MKLRFGLLTLLSCCSALAAPSGAVFNVKDYGASPDGVTKDTDAIAKTVAAAAAAGGGTVYFPAGKYLTGSIQLESNITLFLEAGAIVLYSPDPADSPLVPTRWEGINAWAHAPLVYANHKENIAIIGRGTLNGQGENWWGRTGRGDPKKATQTRAAHEAWLALIDRAEKGETLKKEDFTLAADFLRPTLVETYECKNILLDGITITDSPFWNFHPLYSENIVVHAVSIVSWGPNGDGIDVDSCRDVRISDSFFTTGDDCIVIKSGKDAEGRRLARPTEHVTVTNCVMYKGHGAIVIGSENSGDIRNIAASNIVAKGTECAVRIKSNRGRGGIVENVRCDNFVVEGAVKKAIEITLLYVRSPAEPLSERTPSFKNFAFSNFTIVNARQVASIQGLPEKSIEGLRFTDITASGDIGFLCDHAVDVELHGVRVNSHTGSAFVFDTVRNLVMDDVGNSAPLKGLPTMKMSNADYVWLRNARAAMGTETFLQVDGAKPAHLKFANNDFSAASSALVPADLGQ